MSNGNKNQSHPASSGGPKKLKPITLQPDELDRLMRPVNGEGGFQNLLKKLQAAISGNQLCVDTETLERMDRYAGDYGSGGFQGRLRDLVDRIRTANKSAS